MNTIINIAAVCDKAGRRENQDNYLVMPHVADGSATSSYTNDEDIIVTTLGALFVVADGMGGMNAGEKASELVVSSIKSAFSDVRQEDIESPDSVMAFVHNAIIAADRAVKGHALSHPETQGMGSTIALLWLLGGKAYTAWCGDSRIYCFNPNNSLVRLSHDHSYVQSLVDAGKMDESLAFNHPDSNIITRSLGDSGETARPEMKVYDIHRGDVFLLCSDGLCGLLHERKIETLLAENTTSMENALAALWAEGERAGFTDNCTIELVRIANGGLSPKGIATGYDSARRPSVAVSQGMTSPAGMGQATAPASAGKQDTPTDEPVFEAIDVVPVSAAPQMQPRYSQPRKRSSRMWITLLLLLIVAAGVFLALYLFNQEKPGESIPGESETTIVNQPENANDEGRQVDDVRFDAESAAARVQEHIDHHADGRNKEHETELPATPYQDKEQQAVSAIDADIEQMAYDVKSIKEAVTNKDMQEARRLIEEFDKNYKRLIHHKSLSPMSRQRLNDLKQEVERCRAKLPRKEQSKRNT